MRGLLLDQSKPAERGHCGAAPPEAAYAVRVPSGPRALTDGAEALLPVNVHACPAALLTTAETRRRSGLDYGCASAQKNI